MKGSMLRNLFALMVGVCLFGSVVHAQLGTGSIVGTVQDESGAAVPGANVVVTHVDTGISRTVATDGAGGLVLRSRYELSQTTLQTRSTSISAAFSTCSLRCRIWWGSSPKRRPRWPA